jgi:hypothetical protein
VTLLLDDEHAEDAERAIARIGLPASNPLRKQFERAGGRLRARLVRTFGRLARLGPEGGLSVLLGALTDADPKTRRNAAIALGHVPPPADGVEAALLRAWHEDPRPEMRRSIAASLGKVGGADALPQLREAAGASDPELARIAARAAMMVERTHSRGPAPSATLDGAASPRLPVEVRATSRAGLEDVMVAELRDVPAVSGARVVGPGTVAFRLAGPLNTLFAARTMITFAFPLPAATLAEGRSAADALAGIVASPLAQQILSTWTRGRPRYRIAWADGAHRRAATWEAARAIAQAAPDLVNDPRSSTWELSVSTPPGRVEAVLTPRAIDDPRFTWRLGDVPAASHPTVAAALAWVAGARPDDVVWDPFVGSGGELAERARLGPYAALIGSDLDPRALDVARRNLEAAGARATLEHADATVLAPEGVTLIITNPPMGRRASREAGLSSVLDRFVAHAASVLRPGGRMVWIAPWPDRARAAGVSAGLALDWSRTLDMGGFTGEIQRWLRP